MFLMKEVMRTVTQEGLNINSESDVRLNTDGLTGLVMGHWQRVSVFRAETLGLRRDR